jgi:hypothetical protein
LPAHKGHAGGCTVCAHPEKTRIELLLAGGAGQTAVGRKYSLSNHAIHRHWHNHVTEERRAALILGPVQRQALASQVMEEATSVLDHHRAVRAGLYSGFDAAVTAGDKTATALLGGKLIEVNNAIAKLTGQLATSPLVQQTTINFHSSTEYMRLRDGLLQLAREHPDVRPALVAMLRRLDSEPAEAAKPGRPAPLVLEHEAAADG